MAKKKNKKAANKKKGIVLGHAISGVSSFKIGGDAITLSPSPPPSKKSTDDQTQ